MSYVNNALLSFSILEDQEARMAEVQDALPNEQRFANGWDPPDRECWWGGSKYPERPLWGAAFNYVDFYAVADAVRAARWEYPEEVQILWCGQDDDLWTLHTPVADRAA